MEEGEHDRLVVNKDWKGVTMPLEDIQMKRQTSIQDLTRKRARVDESVQGVENIPEVRKILTINPKSTKRKRTTGKLTKKEQKGMKETLRDVGLLLAPPKPLVVKS